ncbi:MAG: CvpA family protein, partial [Oscillospiraceae bacterium]|nr:CvpA family protein [Oscillospiraceae bacterium]
MKGIIDILILIILVCGLWTGYKKGLIMGILGMLVLMVSIYGANLLSNTFSYDVVVALKPFAAGFVEDKIEGEDGAVESLGWENE